MRRLPPVVAVCLLAAALAGVDGPGLGNPTWQSSELWTKVATFSSDNGAPRGHGNVLMVRGYLLVVFSDDGGGGKGSGGFALYDVSNPRSPVLKMTTSGNSAYAAGGANDPTYIREAHSLPMRGDIICMPTNRSGGSGLQFWNFAEPLSPALVGSIVLSGLGSGDYAATPWWVAWQGRYVYVAGTSQGLYIVDAADPTNPVLATRPGGGANPIPTTQLGGFRVNTVNAVGSLMVLTNADNQNGLATLDIADPLAPQLLWSTTGSHAGYSAVINGGRLYTAREPVQVWSLADRGAPTVVGTAPDVAGRGGYGLVQDGYWFLGSSDRVLKVDVSTVTAPTIAGQGTPAGISSADWDFGMPLGNIVFAGNDHSSGSAFMPHQAAPDTAAPQVTMVDPASNATGVATSIRVGLTFSDQLDVRTLTSSNVRLRPVGGSAVPAWVAFQHGILSIHPQAALAVGTIYEVVVSGVKDLVGNAIASTYTSRFTTTGSATPVTAALAATSPAATGASASFTASGTGSGTLQYRFDFGDGTVRDYASSATASRTYAAPGHYTVQVTVRDGNGATASASRVQTVHRPLPTQRPTVSSPLLVDGVGGKVWCVNPDAGTVAAVAIATNARAFERAVGPQPLAVARAADGTIWVVCAGDDTVRVLAASDGAQAASIALPHGSAPAGIAMTPDGATAFVACSGSGRVIKIPTAARSVSASAAVAPHLRGIAVTQDGARVLVTRFLSPDTRGEVIEVRPSDLGVVRTIALAIDATADAEDAGRGLPNHLAAVALSPDGARAWIPAKKDNIQRGQRRDGLALTFESTVRTIVCQIDLGTNAEVAAARRDLNDRDSARAVAFSPLGDWAFVAVQGSDTVEVFDAYSGARTLSIVDVGSAPQGVAVDAGGTRLYVQGFLSRTLRVFDISALTSGQATSATPVANVATVVTEPLSAQVLAGKRIFYKAADPRMSRDGYVSCASCHVDGGHDGRVWDFSDRGEGLRNTIDLRGRRGAAQGRVHWSANFDEIHDFEHDIRGPFGGSGFLSDAQFGTGTRNQPLGDAKAGVSADLDALAAYVASLATVGRSPHRTAEGALTADAVAGKLIFQRLDCASCHRGADFTDSSLGAVHDVGTIKPTSGNRLGGALTGIDTPTLRGLWGSAPYLHDGSAATLLDVIVTANSTGAHGATGALSTPERGQLVAYLQQIDDAEPARTVATVSIAAVTATANEAGAAGAVRVTRGGATTDALAVLLQDTAVEGTETVIVAIAENSAYTVSGGAATVAIADDESAPALTIANATRAEGDSGNAGLTFTVTLSAASAQTVTVAYATANGSAVAGADYVAASGTLTFTPGQTSRTLQVQVTGDVLDEADETFTVTLSSATNAAIGTASATGTITDDDAAPTLAVADATVAEGNAGSAALTFTVTLSAASGRSVTVAYATSNGSAQAGSDYTAASGTLTIAAGQTSGSVAVQAMGDSRDEPDETLTLTLSSPANATISDATATGTITDDDPTPTLRVDDASVTEGNTGSATLSFAVRLSAASGRTVTVAYATANGTATAGSDYVAASGTLSFAAGETSKTVAVAVTGDTAVEPDETLTLTLASPSNAAIADASGAGAIVDDDGASQTIRVNFQPATAAAVVGWLIDSGAAFGDRGGGRSYGWNGDNRGTTRDRNHAGSQDQRYDTLIHLQKPELPDARWEIAVPNGSYSVRIVAGDPAFFDGVFRTAVEGVVAVDATPTTSTRWVDRTVTVTVDDGRLTVGNAAGAQNNKLCFIEIVPIAIPSGEG